MGLIAEPPVFASPRFGEAMFDEAWGKRSAGGWVPTAQRDRFATDKWQNHAIG
jgi:hypothetical protein